MATATHFGWIVPATANGGVGFRTTVTALDGANNVDTGYQGVVNFSTSDSFGGIPPKSTLSSGVGVFSYTLNTQGNQTVTGVDKNSHITGVSTLISVLTPGITHMQVVAAPTAFAGVPFSFTVKALDQSNTVRPDYTGTVHLTTNDTAAFLSPDGTLFAGVGVFSAVLNTTGTVKLSATDSINGAVTGTINISVIAVPVIPANIPPGNTWTEVHYPYATGPAVLQVCSMLAGAAGPFAYDFSNDPLMASGQDNVNQLIDVIATPISPTVTGPDLDIVLTSVVLNKAIAVLSGPQAGVEYLVSFVIQTTNGYTRIGRGVLDIV